MYVGLFTDSSWMEKLINEYCDASIRVGVVGCKQFISIYKSQVVPFSWKTAIVEISLRFNLNIFAMFQLILHTFAHILESDYLR